MIIKRSVDYLKEVQQPKIMLLPTLRVFDIIIRSRNTLHTNETATGKRGCFYKELLTIRLAQQLWRI